jgi:hypothetical protein
VWVVFGARSVNARCIPRLVPKINRPAWPRAAWRRDTQLVSTGAARIQVIQQVCGFLLAVGSLSSGAPSTSASGISCMGTIVSGEKLVDDEDFRAALRRMRWRRTTSLTLTGRWSTFLRPSASGSMNAATTSHTLLVHKIGASTLGFLPRAIQILCLEPPI